MTRGPLHLFRRRTLRGLAGFVVTFLLAGHALAASGLCVVTIPDAPATLHDTSVACAEHLADSDQPTAVKHHCPAEEPTPQARTVDLPSLQVLAIGAVEFELVSPIRNSLPQTITEHEVPPPPLYARLQRLRL